MIIRSKTKYSHPLVFRFFMKKLILSCPINFLSTKKTPYSYFLTFHEKTKALKLIFCQKTSTLSKIPALVAEKKNKLCRKHASIMPFFPDFSNNCCSHAYFLSEKRPISKIQSSNSFIFRISIKKPLLLCLYLSKMRPGPYLVK